MPGSRRSRSAAWATNSCPFNAGPEKQTQSEGVQTLHFRRSNLFFFNSLRRLAADKLPRRHNDKTRASGIGNMWFMVRLCWFCQRILLLHADQDPKETFSRTACAGMIQRLVHSRPESSDLVTEPPNKRDQPGRAILGWHARWCPRQMPTAGANYQASGARNHNTRSVPTSQEVTSSSCPDWL